MENTLLQNIDSPQDNPTTPQIINTDNNTPKDPKVIILIVLTTIIAILLIVAAIVSATRGNRPPVKKNSNNSPAPTDLPSASPTPSPGQIPEEFQVQFNKIEKEINNLNNLLPPEIDTKIGIEIK